MTTSIMKLSCFCRLKQPYRDYLANELTSAIVKNVGFKIFLNDNLIHVNSDSKGNCLGHNKEMTEASELKLSVQYYKYGNVQPGNVKRSVIYYKLSVINAKLHSP
ncbi:hypothetical protein [Salmonella enterica]|uniref:hypothetical protein n=1 Tax=Salmonella enterica TaxID=28901 RepID=UPI003857BAC8